MLRVSSSASWHLVTELHLQARKTKKKGDALIKWEMLNVSSSDSSYLVKELCQQVRKTKREMLQQEEKFAFSVSLSAKLDIWCNNFTRERRTRRRQREKCSDKKRTLLLVFLHQPSLIFGATISQGREAQGEDKERNAPTRRELCF